MRGERLLDITTGALLGEVIQRTVDPAWWVSIAAALVVLVIVHICRRPHL